MPKIFVVQGNCGEYSDYREWIVCGYRTLAKAQKHAVLAKQWLQAHVTYDTSYEERGKMNNPYDHQKSPYGTDPQADWTAYEVELRSTLPKVKRP